MIREWRPADQADLARLWQAAWQVTMPAIDFAARLEWFDAHLAQMRADGVVILCAVDVADRVIGFATLEPDAGGMDQLAVAPEAFGSGVAVALLDEVKRRAPREIWLSVNQDNPRALRFYLREGFHVVGTDVNPTSGLAIFHMEWHDPRPITWPPPMPIR